MKKNKLRTATGHVVERVEARMAAPREVGSETQVAGRQLRPGRERDMALDFLRQLGASAGRHAPGTGSDGALGEVIAFEVEEDVVGGGLGEKRKAVLGVEGLSQRHCQVNSPPGTMPG